MIYENGRVVRAAGGLSNVLEALKIANRRHDYLWCVPIHPFSSGVCTDCVAVG
jgi:hypothetical protein